MNIDKNSQIDRNKYAIFGRLVSVIECKIIEHILGMICECISKRSITFFCLLTKSTSEPRSDDHGSTMWVLLNDPVGIGSVDVAIDWIDSDGD